MVTFKTKKIKKAKIRTRNRSIQRKIWKKKRTFSKYLLKFFLFLVVFSTIGLVIAGIVLYNKIIKPLPPITELSKMPIAQTSSIFDRKWNLLYSVYKEKRTYVDFDKINPKMINAIVAWEDQRFWTNPWFDLIGLARAWITAATTGGPIKWTSTISQQLIKNTFLTNERKIERKIKEIYLSYQMTNEFTKEKIIELYLNKISFGNNAYGIEQASKTYFDKPAKDLIFLESAILASLPKWPTYYSPYSHSDRLMGYPYVYPVDTIDTKKSPEENDKAILENQIKILSDKDGELYAKHITALTDFVGNLKMSRVWDTWDTVLICGLKNDNLKKDLNLDKDGCSVMAFSELLPLLNNIKIKVWTDYIEYQTGRKDFILWRMLEDWYLSSDKKDSDSEFKQYKKSFKNGILFDFKKIKEHIKYPHFIFYVKEYLEKKYGKKVMEEWGLKIYTTLDPDKQDEAQRIIDKYAKTNSWKYGANNAASITINNENGEIISMIWWKDYYNKEISWENNIITSKLQPWSTFKPFVYALAMEKNQIGPKTPVFDVKTRFPWGYEPNNFDGKFMNMMPIEKALNYSRNIPAIKMYYLAWKEKSIINFMKSLWVESYYDFKKYYRKKYWREYNYGAPMALGTGEMTPLELATAYSTIASLGRKREITPILKILDSNGVPIENSNQRNIIEAISPSTAYLITSILTNTKARPASWNKYMTIPWRKMAAKTGTSTKQFKVRGVKKIFPQNVWTIGYTPQYTTVAWVWNTNGKQLKYNASGLMTAGPILRDTMNSIHKWQKVKDWNRPKSIKQAVISRHSWKLASRWTPASARISWLFINPPSTYDNNSFFYQKVDALCNWRVTEKTPAEAIKTISGTKYHSLQPNNKAWEAGVRRVYWFGKINFSNKACKRSDKPSSMRLWAGLLNGWRLVEWGSNTIDVSYDSVNPIIKVDISLDWRIIGSYKIQSQLQWAIQKSFNIPAGVSWSHSITVKAVDNQYYSKTTTISAQSWWKDVRWPSIKITNPARWSINLKSGNSFNLRAAVTDPSSIHSINVYFNGKTIISWSRSKNIVAAISTSGLPKWQYTATIEATDKKFNLSKRSVVVNVIDGKAPTIKKDTKKETLPKDEPKKDIKKEEKSDKKKKKQKKEEPKPTDTKTKKE